MSSVRITKGSFTFLFKRSGQEDLWFSSITYYFTVVQIRGSTNESPLKSCGDMSQLFPEFTLFEVCSRQILLKAMNKVRYGEQIEWKMQILLFIPSKKYIF